MTDVTGAVALFETPRAVNAPNEPLEYDFDVADLETLGRVLSALDASNTKSPSQPPLSDLRRVVTELPPEELREIQARVRDLTESLRAALETRESIVQEIRRLVEHLPDAEVVRLVEESLLPSRVGELTPTHEAMTAAFARGTEKAVAASRVAGLPVHAFVDGQVATMPPRKP